MKYHTLEDGTTWPEDVIDENGEVVEWILRNRFADYPKVRQAILIVASYRHLTEPDYCPAETAIAKLRMIRRAIRKYRKK